ncbi:MAG: YbaN family protein [Sulfuricellaceae bacterium]|nr:YbaN family protein [Sulfuricellaceae bacterium]
MSRLHDSRLMRAFFLVLGFVALLLGLLGIFLPVLPTTPFILLAAACFARGSTRLHDWLLSHRLMGEIVREWQEHRSMPPGIKHWAFLMMVVSFGFSIFMMESSWHRWMLVAFALVLAIFLWRVPVRSSKV